MKSNFITSKKSDENNTALKQNKRIGVCMECGYEWIGRSTKSEKPPRCPECGKRVCAWEDNLSDEELKELKPLLHGITDTTKTEVVAEKEIKPDEATPPDDDVVYADEVSLNEPTIPQKPTPAKKAEPKQPKEAKPKEEKQAEKIYISELKEFATVIDNPNTDTEVEKPPAVAWKDKNGDIRYGTVLDTETVQEIEEILEAAADKEIIPTQKDIDVLKAAGVFDEDFLSFEREEKELRETQQQKPGKKAEAKGGVPIIGLVIVGGLMACAVLPLLNPSKTSAKKRAKAIDKKLSQTSENTKSQNIFNYSGNFAGF